LFEKAQASDDPGQKRAFLDQIARATSVDSVRRKRAANELAALEAQTVDVSELPSAPKKVAQAARTAPGAVDEPAAPDAKAAALKDPAATLVRKNPFDDEAAPSSAQDADRTKLLQAKATLRQKVQSGQATDRDLKMLRAVCKQLGDVSCSN